MSLKDSVWRLLFTVNSAGFLLMSAVILVVDSIATYFIIQKVPWSKLHVAASSNPHCNPCIWGGTYYPDDVRPSTEKFTKSLVLCIHCVMRLFEFRRDEMITGIYVVVIRLRSHGGLTGSLSKFFNGIRTKINVAETLFALFSANLIGISFARSLHYQFYSWYYHQLPFLLFWDSSRTSDRPTLTFVVSILMKALVLVGVEICWNVYPSTVASAFLNLYHISILVYLFLDYFERSELTKKAN